MSDEQVPLDLRALADVDSPEVVRAALKTFRRRVITRYVWMALGVVVLVVAVLWGRTPSTLQQRIDTARITGQSGSVWHVDGGTVALDRIVDLGDTVGLHLIVLPDGRNRLAPSVSISGQIASMAYGTWELYVEVARTSGDAPVLTIRVPGHIERITLDDHVGIPAQMWR